METSPAPIVCIESLTESELFAICAARIYRETREHPHSGCTCLPRIFSAAHVAAALPAFMQLQVALSVDPEHTITYEERAARYIGSGELALLQALAAWQRDPAQDPQSALWFIPVRAIRRVASDAGRAFAVELATVGLLLPDRGPDRTQPSSLMRDTARAHGSRRVH